ncbi:c-type cytochrome [Parasediminibacterium paludis]|uniref:C-type cytochrome n=1 Tax=Parasediminibacterium paludis TaxID=908966 RepID=A0ABV8PUA8_9BACT
MKKVLLLSFFSVTVLFCVVAQVKKPQPKVVVNNAATSIERGKVVYQKECLSCHQADGGGVPHLNPPLYESTDVVGDKKKIISIVLRGMTDRVPIDGEYYSNNMAPHQELSNLQIADVLTFIRASWGNKASAVTPAEVQAVRGVKKK